MAAALSFLNRPTSYDKCSVSRINWIHIYALGLIHSSNILISNVEARECSMTKIMTFTIFVLTAFHVNAQESISTLGQDLIISSGSLSFTLGQISNETQNLSSYSLQEGVQQVYSDNSTFGIVKSDSEYAFEIYPNPFQNHIIIQAQKDQLSGAKYNIYDISGRLVIGGEIEESSTHIETEFLPSASYILNITDSKRLNHSVNIEKIK